MVPIELSTQNSYFHIQILHRLATIHKAAAEADRQTDRRRDRNKPIAQHYRRSKRYGLLTMINEAK